MFSFAQSRNVKTGRAALFELERQAGISYRNDGNDWNRSDLFDRERLELFECSVPVR
jgi:hypothetical protein